jgi:hypothetical protein
VAAEQDVVDRPADLMGADRGRDAADAGAEAGHGDRPHALADGLTAGERAVPDEQEHRPGGNVAMPART